MGSNHYVTHFHKKATSQFTPI